MIRRPPRSTLFPYTTLFRSLADVLRVFDHVFILTGGGPGTTTQLLSLYMYRVEFKFFDTGQAAALAVVVTVSFTPIYSLIPRVLPLARAATSWPPCASPRRRARPSRPAPSPSWTASRPSRPAAPPSR